MITRVDIRLLSPDLRKQVLEDYKRGLKGATRMSYQEAAFLYGYTYQTIRALVTRGRIKSGGAGDKRWITHSAMRRYISGKQRDGAPRKALRNIQTQIP